ncbi:MAG: hypothetical protein QW728_07040 [Thermoplasmata archaeon]
MVSAMTAQFPDKFVLDGEVFSIAGFRGDEKTLFNPTKHGLEPAPVCTACWRGYILTYSLSGDKLVLQDLEIGCSKDKYPALNGKSPLLRGQTEERMVLPAKYKDLNIFVSYSGSFLIGKGFIRELYVHMGFHPAWKYETVIELTFKEGILVDKKDLSDVMKQKREEMSKKPKEPAADSTPEELKKWIEKSFDQCY